MQPYLDAKSAADAATHSIPTSTWRSLQLAVAVLNRLKAPPAGSATCSMPPELAGVLPSAELALLQRHLARALSCSPEELLLTGPFSSSNNCVLLLTSCFSPSPV